MFQKTRPGFIIQHPFLSLLVFITPPKTEEPLLYLFRACCAPTTLSTRKAADLVHVVSEQTAAEIDVHLKGVPLRLREIIAFVQLLRSKIGQRS